MKISRLADYSTKICLAMTQDNNNLYSASQLADITGLSGATVSKLLKLLARKKLVISKLGSQGGYKLAKQASLISLADIVSAIDGDIALTSCVRQGDCALESHCSTKSNWHTVSNVINAVLSEISLDKMLQPIQQTILLEQLRSKL